MAGETVSEPDQALMSETLAPISPTSISSLSPAIHDSRHPVGDRLDPPFADFIGRCFLRGCLFVDSLQSWAGKKQAPPDARIASAESWRHHLYVLGWLRSSLGAASCTAIAGCLIPVFSGNAYRALVPLLFLLVILYVALRFGHVAGILGTVCAALVFEIFLFEPTLSFAIESPTARNHLISMVILGICASEFLGRRKAPAVYKPW